MGLFRRVDGAIRRACANAHAWTLRKVQRAHVSEVGQGTTEYAILVGVLVVIAMLAITVFKPKIQSLWDAIASGINGL